MVTRRPTGPPISTGPTNASAASIPPYPTTPTDSSSKPAREAESVYSPDLNASPAFDLIDMHEARRQRSNDENDDDNHSRDSWEDSDDEDAYHEGKKDEAHEGTLRPQPLNVRASQEKLRESNANAPQGKRESLPSILKPGPVNGQAPAGIPKFEVTRNNTLQRDYTDDTGMNPWATEAKPQPVNWQQQVQQEQQRLQTGAAHEHGPPHGQDQGLKNRASMWWAQDEPSQEPQSPLPPAHAPPAPPVELPTQKTPIDESSRMSLASWETAERFSVPQQGQAPFPPVAPQRSGGSSNSNPWTQEEGHPTQASAAPPMSAFEQAQGQYAPPPGPPPPTTEEQYQPPLGPPPSHTANLSRRPVPISTAQASGHVSTDSVPETPQTRIRRQRSEHYTIRHIRWQDQAQLRTSPILTQNANGPCPLLALVNALVLSTPDHESTALVSTLETRETISLGLLLDAVFDELTSSRRNSTDNLPDVSELYSFLLALHTGMNVNPRFVPASPLSEAPPSPGLGNMHPAHRAGNQAGGFEQTTELKLYSTFSVPLLHGWLPEPQDEAYKAFERNAQSFDAAQTLPFAEPELQHKLNTEGLSGQETQLLHDIETVKKFLNTWPTQLTEHGLDAIHRTLQPAQVAILFRNDHFSTVYKDPKSGALMTLVTDTGYAGHDEIVWESLVDVNGAASEMFSGDFRSVSHGQDAHVASQNVGVTGSSHAVDSRSRYHGRSSSRQESPLPVSAEGPPPPLPGPRPTSQHAQQSPPPRDVDSSLAIPAAEQRRTSEQEDHDLALALQLQEEEEAEQRAAEQRQRRNEQLSQQFLERESVEGTPPAIPPRRSRRESTNRTNPQSIPVSARPSRTERERADGEEDLPSYEQAASDRPYRETGSTALPLQGQPLNAYDALRQQQSAYAVNSSTTVNSIPPHQRRRSDGNRMRRRSSQMQGNGYPGAPVNIYSAGGPVPRMGQTAGAPGAPAVRDAEERCNVM